MASDITSDLDIERAIYRECAGASEALARAFRRAAERPGGLSPDELTQLRGLARRTGYLILAIGFPSSIEKGTP